MVARASYKQTRGVAGLPGFFLTAAALALLLLGALTAPAHAENATGLLLFHDGLASAEGGGLLPPEVTGRFDVARPAGLDAAAGATLKLDYSNYEPLHRTRDHGARAGWRTRAFDLQFVAPLSAPTARNGCRLGLRQARGHDKLDYTDPVEQLDYHGRYSTQWEQVALEVDSGDFNFGAAVRRSDAGAHAWGETLRDDLRLPDWVTTLPTLTASGPGYTLAATHQQGRWQTGLQYDWSRLEDRLDLQFDRVHINSPGALNHQRLEAFIIQHHQTHKYFLTGWSDRADQSGLIYTGLMERGQIEYESEDWCVQVGRRVDRPRYLRQWVLDYRSTNLRLDGDGSAGLLPGIAGEVFLLRSQGSVRTISLRHGRRWPLNRKLDALLGVSLHHSMIDANWIVRKVPSLGQDPETVDEYDEDGTFDLLALTLGLRRDTPRLTATAGITVGYGQVSGFGETDDDVPSERNSKMRPRPLLNLSMLYRF